MHHTALRALQTSSFVNYCERELAIGGILQTKKAAAAAF
jgi:hypothetical protein